MAVEYKITVNSDLENRVQGFAYSVVPVGTNVAGTTWKLALTQYLTDLNGSTATQAPSLPAAVTQPDLDAGDFYEWLFTVELDAGLSDVDKETEVQTQLLADEPGIIAVLQNRLRFWGREGQAV